MQSLLRYVGLAADDASPSTLVAAAASPSHVSAMLKRLNALVSALSSVDADAAAVVSPVRSTRRRPEQRCGSPHSGGVASTSRRRAAHAGTADNVSIARSSARRRVSCLSTATASSSVTPTRCGRQPASAAPLSVSRQSQRRAAALAQAAAALRAQQVGQDLVLASLEGEVARARDDAADMRRDCEWLRAHKAVLDAVAGVSESVRRERVAHEPELLASPARVLARARLRSRSSAGSARDGDGDGAFPTLQFCQSVSRRRAERRADASHSATRTSHRRAHHLEEARLCESAAQTDAIAVTTVASDAPASCATRTTTSGSGAEAYRSLNRTMRAIAHAQQRRPSSWRLFLFDGI